MASSTAWALVFLGLICLTPILALSKDTFSALDNSDTLKQDHFLESRQKRAVDPGLVVSIFGLVYSIGQTIASAITDPTAEIMAKLDEIRTDLRKINQKLDQLSDQVQNVLRSIEQTHDVTRITSVFSDDMIRLNYFKLFVENNANYNDAHQIILSERSREWAKAVLSQDDSGMGPVLHSIHTMITGSTLLKPIRDVYMNGLLVPADPDIWTKMETMKDALLKMELVGYALWSIAFDITGRPGEKVNTVQRLLENRFDIQQEYLVVDKRFKVWPAGNYGLVKTASGCPSGVWATGSRYHDTEDSSAGNSWTPNDIQQYITGEFGEDNMQWEFCMHREYSPTVQYWPSGKYCIFADRLSCPSGFSRGSLYFDDEDDDNANRISGSLPAGAYDSNTRYEFCCRKDGSESTKIALPVNRPFVLFPMHSFACQQVKKMRVTGLILHWDCQDGDNENERVFPYPREDDQAKNMHIHMCYYTAE